MRRLLFIAVVCSVCCAPLAARVARAQAQVSDTDRAAARELFFDGVKLQDQGKFADALDRFNRAQRVFSAPTHLLHIAECEVALGQLVEGAETYRTLARTPLPSGSPAAFTQAQQQGAAELAQVEPRIPLVKIDVTPANVQNMQVQVDGAPMNVALVGVLRPIDPGTHKVSVFAPGYGKQETQFTLKEREQKTVPIALQPTSGVVYGPAIVPAPVPQTGAPPPVPPPYQNPPPQPTPQPGAQPDQNAQEQQWQTTRRTSSSSLLAGLTLGASIPLGSAAQTKATDGSLTTTSMSEVASTGGAVGLDGAFRFATHWMVAFGFEHGIYGKGSTDLAQRIGLTGTTSTSVSSNLVDLRFAYISNPFGVGFYGELGVGYRWLIADVSQGGVDVSDVVRGTEFSLGAGVFIKAGDYVRLIPKINFGIGSFTTEDLNCSGSTASGCTSVSGSIPNTATHTFVFLGLGGYYNYDLGRR